MAEQRRVRDRLLRAVTPPQELTVDELVQGLDDAETELAMHRELIRDIPSRILRPLRDSALKRIRKSAADESLPAAALAPISTTLGPGLAATIDRDALVAELVAQGASIRDIAIAAADRGFILGSTTLTQSPAREARLILTPDGRILTIPVEFLSMEETPPSVTPPAPAEVSSPGPLPLGPETAPAVTLEQTIRPGDMVESPLGRGRVLQEQPGTPGTFEIQLEGKEAKVYYDRTVLRVLSSS